MSHFKMLVLVILAVILGPVALADGIGSLYFCHNHLQKQGLVGASHFGSLNKKVFVVKKSATEKDFLIFDTHAIYRCELPKEHMLLPTFMSCQKKQGNITTYYMELGIGGAPAVPVAYGFDKAKPQESQHTSTWEYRSTIPPEYKFCEATCREDLNPNTQKLVEEQIAENLELATKRTMDVIQRRKSAKVSACTSVGAAIGRGFSNLMNSVGKTEDGCIAEANRDVAKFSERTIAQTMDALKACGGQFAEASLDQQSRIKELADFAPGVPVNVKASGDSKIEATARKDSDALR